MPLPITHCNDLDPSRDFTRFKSKLLNSLCAEEDIYSILIPALKSLWEKFEHSRNWELFKSVFDTMKPPLQLVKDTGRAMRTDFFVATSLNDYSSSILLLSILVVSCCEIVILISLREAHF